LRRTKAILAANITDRQQCQQRFKEHRKNNVWRDYLAKSRTVNGYFMKRYKMSENAFNMLVDILNMQVDETKSKNITDGIKMICPHHCCSWTSMAWRRQIEIHQGHFPFFIVVSTTDCQ
jgi:hypothetical protein